MVKFDFSGKTAIVTGASGGIGAATAKLFAQNGANVVIGDINPSGQKVAQEIKDAGGKAIFVKTDVADSTSVKNLIDQAIQAYGKIDVAFNNAGMANLPDKASDMPEEEYDKAMNVDAKCVFLCMKYELDNMRKHNGGAIVNTSSISGLSAKPDNMLPYIAAKHAVIGMTRSAAFDHAKEGIRVNTIAPGLIETEMTEGYKDTPEKWAEMTGLNPMNAAGKPIDIANMVLFLCSDASRFTTASVISVDGGQAAL
ncbi:SDR family NAD(P)-dependent oxidoreductase [Ligilactobacillus pobuzihii]|uniref:Short-chain dehydrogenase oxidoreductase n=1 Tax=Ligilactobacillus pobuzihii TaxID=449659 RepID=A0A0R2LHZ1_9LACO|nr:glucose 1-dehydrogenase [Ligilactobacillus pobuzihii]KRK09267.1 short-chain dehydrogenase oxidoreductase [Ligilactobacillus pobuzihii E100301 = KCTC 13174]KRO01158.1 short-chain dehydrogenase oxidoreductase [Ligilactobacillus pobuzihii]GEN49082.1 short chain dehydrogenase [Ligilactobacillus pobuzihii]